MKYIISEEQKTVIDQSQLDMGPLGPSIRKIVELYGGDFIEKFVVIYFEEYNNYMVFIWSNKGSLSIQFEHKITKFIKQFIPVDVITTIIP